MQKMATMLLGAPALVQQTAEKMHNQRRNDVVWLLIAIPIAAILFMGLIAAWFWYCQQRGMWPAMDMPSWESGGTWKLYCHS